MGGGGLTSLARALGPIHTWVVEVEVQRVPDLAAGLHGAVGAVELREVAHALVPQVAHEELQADEGEDAEAEDGEDHHVGQLLHGLDQRPHDGLQALGEATTSMGSPTGMGPPAPLGRDRPEGVLGHVGHQEVGQREGGLSFAEMLS